MVDRSLSGVVDRMAAALGTGPTAATALKVVAPSLDSIPVRNVTSPRQTVGIGDDKVTNIRLNDGSWMSDDWDKVAAYALSKMTWGQYDAMMRRVGVYYEHLAEESPDGDTTLRSMQSLQQWAKEKLST